MATGMICSSYSSYFRNMHNPILCFLPWSRLHVPVAKPSMPRLIYVLVFLKLKIIIFSVILRSRFHGTARSIWKTGQTWQYLAEGSPAKLKKGDLSFFELAELGDAYTIIASMIQPDGTRIVLHLQVLWQTSSETAGRCKGLAPKKGGWAPLLDVIYAMSPTYGFGWTASGKRMAWP